MSALSIVLAAIAIVVGGAIGYFVRKSTYEQKVDQARNSAEGIISSAKKDAETAKKEAIIEAKEESHQYRASIEEELKGRIDDFSQGVVISQIELLLNYSNRFYSRQFITRKAVSNDLLQKVEDVLHTYFQSPQAEKQGLPTVQFLSEQLNVSASYLSDMLRSLTGQNTQQHIHNHLIEKAKEKLSTSDASISEIAYELGFEHPQSFSKLFKLKTGVSPLNFRRSFN